MEEPFLNKDLFIQLLIAGRSILNLQVGIVSKVYGEKYELIAIDDVSNEFKGGDILQLDQTYCREVIATGKTIALSEIDGVRGLRKHPLYVANTLEAYIGAPIQFNESVWGTINFSSMLIRHNKFTSTEIKLVNSYAGLIADSMKSE